MPLSTATTNDPEMAHVIAAKVHIFGEILLPLGYTSNVGKLLFLQELSQLNVCFFGNMLHFSSKITIFWWKCERIQLFSSKIGLN